MINKPPCSLSNNWLTQAAFLPLLPCALFSILWSMLTCRAFALLLSRMTLTCNETSEKDMQASPRENHCRRWPFITIKALRYHYCCWATFSIQKMHAVLWNGRWGVSCDAPFPFVFTETALFLLEISCCDSIALLGVDCGYQVFWIVGFVPRHLFARLCEYLSVVLICLKGMQWV